MMSGMTFDFYSQMIKNHACLCFSTHLALPCNLPDTDGQISHPRWIIYSSLEARFFFRVFLMMAIQLLSAEKFNT
jgi:hypothetical protein